MVHARLQRALEIIENLENKQKKFNAWKHHGFLNNNLTQPQKHFPTCLHRCLLKVDTK